MSIPVPSPENFPRGKPVGHKFGKPMITVRVEPEFKARLDARLTKLNISQNQFCIEAIETLLNYWDDEDRATSKSEARESQ
jgi:hypothetical protein